MVENFLIISQQVLVLFILVAVGFLCGKKGLIDDVASKKLTDIVLYVVTPCVMISAFQREFSVELVGKIIIAAVCAALIHAGSILLAKLIFRDKNESRKKVLRFSVIFSNCGFVSLPLQKAILGDEGWFYGSIFVAVFNIFLWTYGLVSMSGDRRQLSVKKLVFNPGIVGVAVALILFLCRINLPEILSLPVDYLAALNTPLPMLIIGYYLSKANFKAAFTDAGIYIAMGVRMVLIPLIALGLMLLFRIDSTIIVAFTIAGSAPTAATTTMFSAKYDRDVELSVGVVASTTVISLVTMPLVTALAQTISG
ncbi:MAG: AEC family transporter [Clostridia bacterium]|nr:AEC family transporter [Clostridia bacterium]